jgi:hypothetical protein
MEEIPAQQVDHEFLSFSTMKEICESCLSLAEFAEITDIQKEQIHTSLLTAHIMIVFIISFEYFHWKYLICTVDLKSLT